MLTLAEELLLLILDDEDGTMLPVPQRTLDFALSGAVLMDLALHNRIDSDPDKIWLSDPSPTGESLLDGPLAGLTGSDSFPSAENWIQLLASEPGQTQDAALARLVERGVLRQEEKRFLWMFEMRRYPLIDNKEEREVKLRIMAVLFSEEIPDPRDIALICLVDSCNLFEDLLGRRELESVRDRIAVVRKLDLIGRATQQTVREIERVVTYMLPVLH